MLEAGRKLVANCMLRRRAMESSSLAVGNQRAVSQLPHTLEALNLQAFVHPDASAALRKRRCRDERIRRVPSRPGQRVGANLPSVRQLNFAAAYTGDSSASDHRNTAGGSKMKVARIGLDIAKQIFELHGVDRSERVVLCKTLKRDDGGIR